VVGYLLAFSFSATLKWLPVQGYTPLAERVTPFLKHSRSRVRPRIPADRFAALQGFVPESNLALTVG
jgi:hypothetical protein